MFDELKKRRYGYSRKLIIVQFRVLLYSKNLHHIINILISDFNIKKTLLKQ